MKREMIVPMITDNLKVLPYVVNSLAIDWAQRDMIRPLGLENYLLMQCVSGYGSIEVNGELIKVRPNDVFIWEPYKAQSYISESHLDWCVNWISFTCQSLPFSLENGFIKTDSCPQSSITIRLHTIKDLLEQELLSSYMRASAELYLLLCEVVIAICGSISKHDAFDIRIITDYMKQHIHKQLNLTKLSELFNISESYICKLFNRHYQVTPIQYFIKLKMNRAKSLLVTNTELKVYEVAELCGYEEHVYFSKVFKKYIGQTPSEYRKLNM